MKQAHLGVTGCFRYALIDEMGSSMSPALKAGFRAPSYSNFDSMICTDATLAGLSLLPSRRVLALNTGMNSEKGSKMSCHSPSLVSKLLQVVNASTQAG